MSLDSRCSFLFTTKTATSITTTIVAPAAQANPVTVETLTPDVAKIEPQKVINNGGITWDKSVNKRLYIIIFTIILFEETRIKIVSGDF